MTEIKTYCDHCGTELNSHNDYEDTDIDIANYFRRVDLCTSCFEKLTAMIEEFFEEEPTDEDIDIPNEERSEDGN